MYFGGFFVRKHSRTEPLPRNSMAHGPADRIEADSRKIEDKISGCPATSNVLIGC